MKNLGFRTAAQATLTLGGLLLLAACNAPSSSQTPSVPSTPTATAPRNLPAPSRPALPDGTTLHPLPTLAGMRIEPSIQPLAVNANTAVVALKVLILSAGSGDFGIASAKSMLDQAGVPYDVIDTASTALTSDSLVAPDGTGRYQGVILTSGSLSYVNTSGAYVSGLDSAGWNTLWNYEAAYKVRQLSLYTYPGSVPEDYGLRDAGAASGTADARLAAGGSSVFTDLKTTISLPIRYAYNYPATLTPVAGVTTTPLLTDASGRVLAATSTTAGRERLALTFAQNPYLLHTELLGYSLVNWLTKGVYLGDYRRFNQLDIDDWFLPDDQFNAVTKTLMPDAFRISASDALALPAQQNALHAQYPAANAFRFSMMFNGVCAATDATTFDQCSYPLTLSDPLTAATRTLSNTFDWVSHTYDHAYMDFLNLTDASGELSKNLTVGTQLGLNMSKKVILSGDMSGLGYYNPAGDGLKTDYGLGASNPNFLQAAVNNGAQFIPSNHSVVSQYDSTCSICGVTHPLNSGIFLVPRWPTNIFYDVTTPDESAAAYNSVYGPTGTFPFWDHNLSFSEILDKESDIGLSHWLSGTAFPHYMHQPNLRQYAPGHSLAYDWEAATLKKYASYSTLPLNTLRWDDLGAYVKDHTSYMKSGTTGSWNRLLHIATIKSGSGGAAYLTGGIGGTLSLYAGKTISRVQLGAGQTTFIFVP
ncbi:Agd3-related carbohydrate deacetylase [Deinococcus ruber]|uniref:Lipoprotein n=1 Tax=Deinococcus ruber TaxID=1848197 RepID=A0A918F2R7_9DEIO|nr:hypothetical protein [Deinococcus ruber]GGQ99379.1 hypothetical protein GCM10008957_10200 [Deinococcus ruber]